MRIASTRKPAKRCVARSAGASECGASPRATLQLVRAAKAHAHLNGRDWLSPDDVKALASHVLPHHLVMHDPHARYEDHRAVVAQALAKTVAPVMR